MPSDEEGNKNQERKKGIKRKSVESAEESANKQLCFSASTSTGITHDDQAKGNVGKINWMKCCDVDSGPVPRCIICENRYELHIDPTTLENHLNEKHPRDIYIRENESPDWIFNYYRPISALHIRCNLSGCKQKLEVAKFKGQFVDHFNRKHEEEAEKRFQGDNEDPEEAKERLTKKFVFYLYTAFKNKEEENVRKLNWMKHCATNNSAARPQCDICQEYHLFYIDPGNFTGHLIETHERYIEVENESPDWIFDYYYPDSITPRNLKCKYENCSYFNEVRKFKGDFVNHFNDERHQREAERRNEGGYEEVEEVERGLMNQFVVYLYNAFRAKEFTAIYDVRYKAWWMEHVKELECNILSCNINGCPQSMKTYNVKFHDCNFRKHIRSRHPEVQLGRKLSDYVLIDDYLIRCKICYEILHYYFITPFTEHLSDVHSIAAPRTAIPADQAINKIKYDDNIIEYDKRLLEYLVKNYLLNKIK